MSYDPKLVAEWFIHRAEQEGEYLTQMKLQKLVYITHGWSLGLFDKPLIDSKVEAWKWGPVIPSLYAEYARYGSRPIVEDCGIFPPLFPEREEALLEENWRVYRGFTAAQLSDLTHRDGTPWSEAYNPNVRFATITEESIKRHYVELRDKG